MKAEKWSSGFGAEIKIIGRLQNQGWKILDHRYLSPAGEIDIIAKDGNTIVAIEVKYRSDADQVHYAISEKQIRRIEGALETFVTHNPGIAFEDLRFDVFLVSPKEVIYIPNAFL